MKGATAVLAADIATDVFQSTLPVKGATPGCDRFGRLFVVSIHAPREGSDVGLRAIGVGQQVSIHAPREGSDRVGLFCEDYPALFQSTLPVKGATHARRN